MAIRLLVADDQQVTRAGVAAMVTGTEIEIACQAHTGDQAVRYADAVTLDVVLLDIMMPGADGLRPWSRSNGGIRNCRW